MPLAPVEVEAVRVGIKLNPRAGLGAGVDDRLLVELLRSALQQQTAGQVAEHVHIGILGGGDEAPRVVFLVTAGHVHAGDDHF